MRKVYTNARSYPWLEGKYHPNGGAGIPNQWYWSCRDPQFCNYAEDLVGSKGPGWHSCSHKKCKSEVLDAGIVTEGQSDTSPTSSWFEYQWQGYAMLVGACADADTESVTINWTNNELQVLHNRALSAMLPGIRSEMSLPNSIYELKDFKTIGRSIDKLRRTFDAIRIAIKRDLNASKDVRNKLWTLRSVMRNVGDAYLQKEFNVNPLMDDISTLWKCLNTFKEKTKFLTLNSEKSLTRHYRADIDPALVEVDTLYGFYPHTEHGAWCASSFGSPWLKGPGFAEQIYAPCTIPTNFNPGTLSRYRKVTCGVAKYIATLEYTYGYTPMGRGLDELAVLADMLGVNFNPAIIWNAIPWTFVVDWVLKVSRFLEGFQVSWIRPAVQITNCCYSIKLRCNIEYSFTKAATAHVPARTRVVCVRKDFTSYDRIVSPLVKSHLIRSDELDSRELLLTAALFGSR